MLPLLFRLQLFLQIINLINQLLLIHLMVFRILLHGSGCDDNILLQFYSHPFRVCEPVCCVLSILEVVIVVCTFAVKGHYCGLQTLNFNFFIRNLHAQLMLLII